MAVTANPGQIFAPNNKRVIRSEPNEFDKATIISVYPREVVEIKHTTVPSRFVIPAGTVKNPSLTVIGPSSWFRDMGEDMPAIEIPNNAVQVANAIVQDYCGSLLMADRQAGPGLMFVPGQWELKEILTKYKMAFDRTVANQKVWYERLVRLADVGWAKTNGNPAAINDLNKLAAEELGLKDKPWMSSTVFAEMIKCVLCGNLRNPAFPICGSCNRIVDKEKAKELGVTQ